MGENRGKRDGRAFESSECCFKCAHTGNSTFLRVGGCYFSWNCRGWCVGVWLNCREQFQRQFLGFKIIRSVRLAVWIIIFKGPPKWGTEGGLKWISFSEWRNFFLNSGDPRDVCNSRQTPTKFLPLSERNRRRCPLLAMNRRDHWKTVCVHIGTRFEMQAQARVTRQLQMMP